MRQTTISKIEAGDRPVWLGEAVALADAVGASLADLVIPLPAPDRLAEAIAERAGYMRRRAIAAAHVDDIQATLAQAQRELSAAGDGAEAASRKVEWIMRIKGESLN